MPVSVFVSIVTTPPPRRDVERVDRDGISLLAEASWSSPTIRAGTRRRRSSATGTRHHRAGPRAGVATASLAGMSRGIVVYLGHERLRRARGLG